MSGDLLLIRLDALSGDTDKVRRAVDLAERRWQSLQDVIDLLAPQRGALNAARYRLGALADAMCDDEDLVQRLTYANRDLAMLADLPADIDTVRRAVTDTLRFLQGVMSAAVQLDATSAELQASLTERCDELQARIATLRGSLTRDATAGAAPGAGVAGAGVAGVGVADVQARRAAWRDYQELLEEIARPLFAEYVDFLSGLTLRDRGLDDQVCEMTDALLTRYRLLTRRSLPLPARQAALGSALDSVVLLGFPEWSVWGIPLVCHEVGLAYAEDRNDDSLAALVDGHVDEPTRSRRYVRELVADAFATYSMGVAYACATMLLRLNPDATASASSEMPRDVDRAQVIMAVLQAEGPGIPSAGGSFTDVVEALDTVWSGAVGRRDSATGPGATWIEDFVAACLAHFRSRKLIPPYDDQRWQFSDRWMSALSEGADDPGWSQEHDAVADILTAAWRIRLVSGDADTAELAENVRRRWSQRTGGR